MSAKDQLFERLSERDENVESVSVETNESEGTVELALDDLTVELSPDEARSFTEELEADAKEDGWYHSGQTKPLIDDIEESAESVE